MQGTGDAGAGFTDPAARPWLPVGDPAAANVAGQRDAPGSVLNLVHDLIEIRRNTPDLRSGPAADVEAPAGVGAWRRGSSTLVALNLSDEATRTDVPAGTIAIGTDRARDGERVGGVIELAPWEGAVIALEG